MTDAFAYDAFASYATDPDGRLVRTVEALLEGFHRRPDVSEDLIRELELCVDGRDFKFPRSRADTESTRAIEQVVRGYQRQCRALIVFCGPSAHQHPWIEREIEWWAQERPDGPIYFAYTHGRYPDPNMRAEYMPASLIKRGGPDNSSLFDLREYHLGGRSRFVRRLKATHASVSKLLKWGVKCVRIASASPANNRAPHKVFQGLEGVSEWVSVRSLDDEVCRIAAQLVSDKTGETLAADGLTAAYLAAEYRTRRRRVVWAVFASTVIIVGICATWIAWDRSERQRRIVALADEAQAEIDSQQYEQAMRLALEGLPIQGDVPWAPRWGNPGVQVLLAKLAGAANLSAFRVKIVEKRRNALTIAEKDQNALTSATFSRDGHRILTTSESGVVSVWDRRSMTRIASCHYVQVVAPADRKNGLHKGSLPWLRDSQFSSDGRRIVSVGPYSTAWIWSPDDATCRRPVMLLGHADDVRTGAFSPDGKLVVTTSDDNTVRIWNAETGQQRLQLLIPGKSHPPDDFTTSAEFSPDGKSLVVTRSDGLIALADTNKFDVVPLEKGPFVWRARFSPDSKKLVTALDNGGVFVWDLSRAAKLPLPKQFQPVVDASFSPDGRFIVTAAADATARIWDLSTLAQRFAFKGHKKNVNRAEFSPDGKEILTSSADGTARIWDAGTTVNPFNARGHTGSIRSSDLSPNGEYFFTAARDGTAWLWTVSNSDLSRLREFKSGHGLVTGAAFHPQEPRIALAYSDGVVSLAGIADREEHTFLRMKKRGYFSISFSPDGEQIAIGSDSSEMDSGIWDLETGRYTQFREATRIRSVEFDRSGTMVAMASEDNSAGIWDTRTGKRLHKRLHPSPFQHSGGVVSVHFSADGAFLVTASLDGTARVWNSSTGKMLNELGHGRDVNAARFSRDGTRIVTASGDHTVRVWDAKTGSQMVRFDMASTARDAFFTAEGTHIVATSDEGDVQVFDVSWTADRSDLPKRVCREKLNGIEKFPTTLVRTRTILQGLDNVNPCERSFERSEPSSK